MSDEPGTNIHRKNRIPLQDEQRVPSIEGNSNQSFNEQQEVRTMKNIENTIIVRVAQLAFAFIVTAGIVYSVSQSFLLV